MTGTKTGGRKWTPEQRKAASEAAKARMAEQAQEPQIQIPADASTDEVKLVEREEAGTQVVRAPEGDYPMTDVWALKEPFDEEGNVIPNPKAGHVFQHRSTYPEDGEWAFVGTIDMHNDTGYGKHVGERILALAKQAVGREMERIAAGLLPPFDPSNKVEVRVRILAPSAGK